MKRTFVVFLAITMLVGCSREENDRSSAMPDGSQSVTTNTAPHTIAVRIDGRDLTRREIIRNAKVLLSLNMNKMRVTAIKQREWKYLQNYCKNAVKHEIQSAAVNRYVKANGLEADTNLIAQVVKTFERRYGIRSKKLKRWHRLDDFKYMVGKNNAPRIDAEIEERVNYELMTRHVLSKHPVDVGEAEIDDRLQRIEAYNKRAAATNALVYVQATNVWQEVVANTNRFEELAKKYSQDEYIDQGCEWGMFTRDQLKEEAGLLALLPEMKIGDITPPIESDNGLAIVRLDPSDDSANITLSRIFFRLAECFDLESRDVARQEILRARQSERIREILEHEVRALKIDYPDGTNVFDQAVTPKEYNECDK